MCFGRVGSSCSTCASTSHDALGKKYCPLGVKEQPLTNLIHVGTITMYNQVPHVEQELPEDIERVTIYR
jgi:hypothetical protein